MIQSYGQRATATVFGDNPPRSQLQKPCFGCMEEYHTAVNGREEAPRLMWKICTLAVIEGEKSKVQNCVFRVRLLCRNRIWE